MHAELLQHNRNVPLGRISPFTARREFRQKSNLERKLPFLKKLGAQERNSRKNSILQEYLLRGKQAWWKLQRLCKSVLCYSSLATSNQVVIPRSVAEYWARALLAATSARTPASTCTFWSGMLPASFPRLVLRPKERQAGAKFGQGCMRRCAIRI